MSEPRKPSTESGPAPSSDPSASDPRTWKDLGCPLKGDGSFDFRRPRPVTPDEMRERWLKENRPER